MRIKSSEEFYKSVAWKYSWFYSDWDKIMAETMQLLIPILKKNNVKKVLDCACGTGTQTIGLLEAGYDVVSSDLSQEMLNEAVKNAEQRGLKITTVQADFRELSSKISGEFDAVICMGNSLPHLNTDEDISKALLNMRQRLKKGGVLVVDTRDFDEMIANEERFLPVRVNVEHGEDLVTILYARDDTLPKCLFHVIYIIQNKKTKEYSFEVESMEYYPLQSETVMRLLKETGFSDIEKIQKPQFIYFVAYKR